MSKNKEYLNQCLERIEGFGKISGKMSIEIALKKIADSPEKEPKKELLEKVFSFLTKREYEVLDFYLGLTQEKILLEEIKEKFSITRERARQIKNKALSRINKRGVNAKDFSKIIGFTEVNLERIFLKNEIFLDEEGNQVYPKLLKKIRFNPLTIDKREIAINSLELEEESTAYLIEEVRHIGFGNYRIFINFYKLT